MPLRLYYHPLSTFSQRVRIALAEKQIPATEYELVELDFPGREHKGEVFRATNPYGRVPAIDHDGFVLFESTAILDYFESLWPSPALVPGEPRARATMAMHVKLCDLEVGTKTGALIFPTRFLPRERWKPEAMAEARHAIERHLELLDGLLGDRTWLVDEQFTLAEVCYAPLVRFFEDVEVKSPPRVGAWIDRVLARPSVRETWLPR